MNIFSIPLRLITIAKLKLHHVKCHYRVIGNAFYINNKGSITLGEKVYLHSYPDGSCFRTALSTYFPESVITIGNNCRLNGTVIHSNERIDIGNNCMFGPGTVLSDNDAHRVTTDYNERLKKAVSRPIIIKDNVWVGMNCIVLKGVTIGENSIVAAGSLVTKDVMANCLYAGSPAKKIKSLSESAADRV